MALWVGNARLGLLQLADGAVPPEWLQVCAECTYHERIGGITFDSQGVCNICEQVRELCRTYGTATPQGAALFEDRLELIRREGKGRDFDCLIGVSGGTDSSWLIRLATTEWGLRPLAVHYDNSWNTAVASQNIANVLQTYRVPLKTYLLHHAIADRIFRAFFLVGVPELEASTDLAYAYVLRRTAQELGIRHILEGHSFTTEGITPLANNYFDGRYVGSVVEEAEKRGLIGPKPDVPKGNDYPLMTLSRFLRSAILSKVTFTRPLWYLDYDKEAAKKILRLEAGWTDYGGHHLENRMTAFFHSIYMPRRFGVDFRCNSLSARARRGLMDRKKAWAVYCQEPYVEYGLEDYFKDRLGISEEQYIASMDQPLRNWSEFPTYKRSFERLEPLFRYLVRKGRVTESFYMKYCQTGSKK